MAATPYTVRLDDEVRQALEEEAKRQDRPAAQVASRAIKQVLQAKQAWRAELEAAVAEADEGVFISGEAMHAWIESWDTDDELPPPEPDIFPSQ